MTISQNTVAELFNDEGSADVPRLARVMSQLDHLWNLAREVSIHVSRMIMLPKKDGGWRDDKALRAIEFSSWLNALCRAS